MLDANNRPPPRQGDRETYPTARRGPNGERLMAVVNWPQPVIAPPPRGHRDMVQIYI